MKHLHTLAREIERAIEEAEGRVAHRLLTTIRRVVIRFGFTRDELHDIMHETLSVVLMKIHDRKFLGRASISTFAYRISTNICLKRIKRLTCRKRGGEAQHIPLDPTIINRLEANPFHCNPLEILKRREQERLTQQSIDALKNPEYQAIFRLLIDGYDRQEISARLKIPVKRVDAVLNYGKKKLSQHLRKRLQAPWSPLYD